jgi:hypothetical protein
MSGDANYYGSAPATLRVEYRSNGVVRFRVQQLGQREQVIDLPGQVADQLLEDISKRDKS